MCELLTPAVVRVCDSISYAKSASKDQLNDSIVKFVDDHFTDSDLSLLQIADHYHISIYTLSRLFKEITGIGFKDYVTGKRIELARHLLMTTEKKVGDIAVEIGFGSVSHFNRIFKANCGMSPSKYKAEAGK
jgi:YesN/AraC family two-component response regulator